MFLFGCREKKPKLKISEFQLLQTNQSPPQVFNSAETAFPKPLSSSPFLEFPSNQTDPDQQTKADIRVRSKEYLTGIARGEKESRARSWNLVYGHVGLVRLSRRERKRALWWDRVHEGRWWSSSVIRFLLWLYLVMNGIEDQIKKEGKKRSFFLSKPAAQLFVN